MATSSSKKKTGTAKKSAPAAKKPASAPKKQTAVPKKQPAAAPTAPTWPYALACIVLSLLAFLGLFHAEGVVIDGFAGFLCGIMGWGFWAFPFAMLLLAWVFVRNPERHFCLRVTASLLIAPLFGTIVHLMVCRVAFTAQTFGAIVGQLYDGGKALTSGGVISGGIGYLLKAGISVYAALPLTMAVPGCAHGARHSTSRTKTCRLRRMRRTNRNRSRCPSRGAVRAVPCRTSRSPRKNSSTFRSRRP